MKDSTLTIQTQQDLVAQIVVCATRLRDEGDAFLIGHFDHLLERAEVLVTMLNINSSQNNWMEKPSKITDRNVVEGRTK